MNLRQKLNYQPVELSFGTSGLRGLVSDMTDLECYINTRGFIKFLFDIKNIKPGTQIALAGDLRDSTPRILLAVNQAIIDSGCKAIYLGIIPTPAAAYFGFKNHVPVAMVTGSHIPSDRNGIKFYKRGSEVLKEDETSIKKAVAKVRKDLYGQNINDSLFNGKGQLRKSAKLPKVTLSATTDFIERYTQLFRDDLLKAKTIILYQHSSVAANMLETLLRDLGAEVIAVDKSKKFIAIDTENVTAQNQLYFKSLAKKYPENFAIISADGDADRPFIVDETGTFHRGDVAGALVAEFLEASSFVVPISASDAVDTYIKKLGGDLQHTKIGSPYVIAAMETQDNAPVVGWEVNGGFLTGDDIKINKRVLAALPTRDAFLPIVCILAAAVYKKCKLSDLFANLPQRFTQAGLLDEFPTQTSQSILEKYILDNAKNRRDLQKIFLPNNGFSKIININSMDGIRVTFSNNDIVHIRPSGNAPQLRVYSVANSQKRADQIVKLAIAEPDGLLRKLATAAKD